MRNNIAHTITIFLYKEQGLFMKLNPSNILSKKSDNSNEKSETAIKPKRKRKIKAKWIIMGVILSAVILFFILRPNNRLPENLVSRVDLTELHYSDIEYTISATGTVESNKSHKVYAGQTYKIEDVLVAVGDSVSIGQQLLTLDTKSLEDQIETKEISMEVTEKSSAQQIKTAADTYLAAQKAIENGTNSSLISADSSVRTAFENLQKAVKAYDDFITARENGTNSTLITQDTQVNSAKMTLDQAGETLNKARKDLEDAKTLHANKPNLAIAKAAFENASFIQDIKEAAYQTALSNYNDAVIDNNNGILDDAGLAAIKALLDTAANELSDAKAVTAAAQITLNMAQADTAANVTAKRTQVETAERTLAQAEASYDAAVRSRHAAYTTSDTTLADYEKNIETAKAAYDTALKSQTATYETARNSLQQNLNSLNSARIGANTDLSDLEYERMLRNLDEAKVLASEAGTITAVYATIGNTASGILFVIEDTGDLIIETTISEYDVGTVKEGMAVTIRSEATKNTVYDGTVISIAPTSNKNVQGNTDRTGDAVFATKIKVTSTDTDLRIGMSVRLNFIIERQEHVLAVPYDAVYTNDSGEECIMVLTKEGNIPPTPANTDLEAFLLKEIPVVTGLENDVRIVVSGDAIEEGITIINTSSNYRDLVGKIIYLTDQMVFSGNQMGGMMFGF